MEMVGSTNGNMARFVGMNVSTSHVGGEVYRFTAEDGSYWEPSVKKVMVQGSSCVFETVHSAYSFRLNPGEKLVMGITV